MAKRKTPTTRKGTAGRAVGKAKSRKPSIKKSAAKRGIGDNKPPPDHVPPPARPALSGWATDTTSQIAHHMALRQRHFRAATGIGTPTADTPHAQTHDPTYLHQVMRQRIAAVEETIKKLAALPAVEQITPRPLDDDQLEEIRNVLAKVKVLPPALTRQPANAVEAPSKLRKFGERVVSSMAEDAAKKVAYAAAGVLWAKYGQQLIDVAQSIGEWLANLPPPPP
jgi:hypothetical protein